ncbi:hypothetical protein ACCZ74_12305 [Agrobacterium vitis]|uniref:hypothetical protein n=1 Tax=Agrobacterium vitis TaxID=373 RepID=UPI00403EE309
MSNSDLVDIAACRHAETEKAILISDDGDRKRAVWVPKEHCEIETDNFKNFITVTMPEWLALDKGFI